MGVPEASVCPGDSGWLHFQNTYVKLEDGAHVWPVEKRRPAFPCFPPASLVPCVPIVPARPTGCSICPWALASDLGYSPLAPPSPALGGLLISIKAANLYPQRQGRYCPPYQPPPMTKGLAAGGPTDG